MASQKQLYTRRVEAEGEFYEEVNCPFCYEIVTGIWEGEHLRAVDICRHFAYYLAGVSGKPSALFEGILETEVT